MISAVSIKTDTDRPYCENIGATTYLVLHWELKQYCPNRIKGSKKKK